MCAAAGNSVQSNSYQADNTTAAGYYIPGQNGPYHYDQGELATF